MTLSSQKTKILIAFACTYFIWGSTYLAIKIGLETMPPFLMAGIRNLAAGIVLYSFERVRGHKNPTGKQLLNGIIIGFFMLLIGNGFLTFAELRVPSGLTALLVSSSPMWFLLFEWLKPHGEKPKPWVISGVILGFGGIALLIAPDKYSSTNVDLLGAGILIFSSISWVIGSLISKEADIPKSPFMTTSLQMMAGGLFMLCTSFIMGEYHGLNILNFSLRSILAMTYLAIFGSLIAFSAYIWLLRILPPALVSTSSFVNPAVAVFIGWALGGEEITVKIILATLIIILAVIIITINNLKKQSPQKVTIPISDGEPIEEGIIKECEEIKTK
jgi:drug/metabolite transporter (DMT)-like permease